MQALELCPDRLPSLAAPCSVIGEIGAAAAAETGLMPGTLVVGGGGDGQAAGLGVNALDPSHAYLNLGTAAVSGTYSKRYRTGTAWRTMGSCSGEGYYYETSLRTGTFLVEWFVREVCRAAESDKTIYGQPRGRSRRLSPSVAVGCSRFRIGGAVMTPYWDPQARGCWLGLTGSHQIGHMYRALLEGVALEQALVSGMIEEQTAEPIKAFVAIGGGAASDLWCQIVADACGKTVLRAKRWRRPAWALAFARRRARAGTPARRRRPAMAGKITGRTEPSRRHAGATPS